MKTSNTSRLATAGILALGLVAATPAWADGDDAIGPVAFIAGLVAGAAVSPSVVVAPPRPVYYAPQPVYSYAPPPPVAYVPAAPGYVYAPGPYRWRDDDRRGWHHGWGHRREDDDDDR